MWCGMVWYVVYGMWCMVSLVCVAWWYGMWCGMVMWCDMLLTS